MNALKIINLVLFAFILLLGSVSFTGLALYSGGKSAVMPQLLAIHLSTVLVFFLLTPFSKMVHEFFRLAALVREAQTRH